MAMTAMKKSLVGLVMAASVVGVASPALAASGTYNLSNGCNIKYSNTYGSNQASSKTERNGGTCYSLSTNFYYYDQNTGTTKLAGGTYVTGNIASAAANTSSRPAKSSHNGRATSGGTAYGVALNF